MKATELISDLEKQIAEHGDCDVIYEYPSRIIESATVLGKIKHCDNIRTRDYFDSSKDFINRILLKP